MTASIGPLAAIIGGALTLLAPCSVMLLPAFFASAFTSPRALTARTLVFWAGLLTTLVPLGAAASTLGALLRSHAGALSVAGGAVVIVLGLLQAAAVPLHLPGPLGGADGTAGGRRDAASPLAVYLLGALYGLAAVGCAGPVLGAVLVMAGLGGSATQAALMMALYATGMALPLGLLALLWDTARLGERAWMRPRPVTVLGRTTTLTELTGGLLCVALGVLLVVGGPDLLSGGVLSTDTVAGVEQSVLAGAAGVPGWLTLAVLGVLAAAVVLLVRDNRRR